MSIGLKLKSKLIKPYIKLKSNFTKFVYKKKNPTCYFSKNVQIIGTKKLALGTNITISRDTWININNREYDDVYMKVGDNSFIGRNNFFTVGKSIELGKYFFSSKDCKFIGAGHEKNPFMPYILGAVEKKNKIIIEDNVCLGAGVTICGNVTIGFGSIIGADSVVVNNIPPLSIAVGSPAKVIKRFDINEKKWKEINEYKENINSSDVSFQIESKKIDINYYASETYWY